MERKKFSQKELENLENIAPILEEDLKKIFEKEEKGDIVIAYRRYSQYR